MRVIVVGGGIIGASAAWHWTARGVRVHLYDKNEVGRGSTSRAAGVLSEVRWDVQDSKWATISRELYSHPPSGGPSLFRETGSITLAKGSDAHHFDRLAPELTAQGLIYEIWDAADLRRRYPALCIADDARALYMPHDGAITASDFAQAAARNAAENGAQVYESTPVQIVADSSRLPAVRRPDGTLDEADLVLISAGAWSAALLRQGGILCPLRPYRTQLAVVDHPQAAELPKAVLHDMILGWYWLPTASGRYLMGDGTEHTESDPDSFRREGDPSFVESLAERLALRSQGGEEATIGHAWAGVCGSTPDRRPLLGPIPGLHGVWVGAGMNGFGVMRGPAVGRAVADWAMGGSSVPERYRADRFAWDGSTFPIREGYELW